MQTNSGQVAGLGGTQGPSSRRRQMSHSERGASGGTLLQPQGLRALAHKTRLPEAFFTFQQKKTFQEQKKDRYGAPWSLRRARDCSPRPCGPGTRAPLHADTPQLQHGKTPPSQREAPASPTPRPRSSPPGAPERQSSQKRRPPGIY